MKKKLLVCLGIISLIFAGSGCKRADSVNKKGFKLVQDRVIEMTYDEFDDSKAMEILSKYDMKMGACSAVKVLLDGKVYVGRNYDFYCSDAPAIIIRNNSGKVRTIGIVNMPDTFAPWTNEKDYKIEDRVKFIAPFACSDVLSEEGIYAETNIRVYEKQSECVSTNPGKPRRCTQTFMQTMLTQYSTIQDILAHINDYDWFDLEKMGFHQSFLLTDKSGYSVIVEFAKNHVYWQESSVNGNYFQNAALYATEKYPCGELRVQKELELYDSIKKPKDIFTMMEAGAYDQFFHLNIDVDYAIPEFFEEIGYDRFSYAKDPEGARKAMKKYIEDRGELTWSERVSSKTWETVFFTVANLSDLELDVHFSEHYKIEFKVSFN